MLLHGGAGNVGGYAVQFARQAGRLKTEVGEVLWLDQARRAHEMLEGLKQPMILARA